MPPTEDPAKNRDVRMRGFAQRTAVAAAQNWVREHAECLQGVETVHLDSAAGRILGESVISGINVPSFPRSMMDGYAVVAANTQGATDYNVLRLDVIGQSMPGHSFDGRVESGQAVRIMTGAPVPDGADAVIPVELTTAFDDCVELQSEITPKKNVGFVGEDIAKESVVLEAGRRLRPQDLGVVSSIGVDHLSVVRRPRVRIVVTGNELLPPGSRPQPNKIIDANSPMLQALVVRDGGAFDHPGILPDTPDAIRESFAAEVDVILVSGGSSVGQEDFAPQILADMGELAIHGIAMRPSSPAGMGRIGSTLVFLLPGNPVSCLCAYDFFAGFAIRRLAGQEERWPYKRVELPLKRKLVSTIGRVDYARVRVEDDGVDPIAISGASVLSSTTRADGFVVINEDSEGMPEGAKVSVFKYG